MCFEANNVLSWIAYLSQISYITILSLYKNWYQYWHARVIVAPKIWYYAH